MLIPLNYIQELYTLSYLSQSHDVLNKTQLCWHILLQAQHHRKLFYSFFRVGVCVSVLWQFMLTYFVASATSLDMFLFVFSCRCLCFRVMTLFNFIFFRIASFNNVALAMKHVRMILFDALLLLTKVRYC